MELPRICDFQPELTFFLLQTASTLTFIVYMLAEHPEVFRRLREEVLERVGSQRRPTYDDFRDMKYLRAVINGELSNPLPYFLTYL